MENFKPQLLPNNKKNIEPYWEERILNPLDWYWSVKHDGGRIGIVMETGMAISRSLKLIRSTKVQQLAMNFTAQCSHDEDSKLIKVIEAELYSPKMTFGEVMHFMNSEDVTSERTRKHLSIEWNKTDGGTNFYLKMVKGVPERQYWNFPGRDVDWLCQWHDDLKFYIFDVYTGCDMVKEDRNELIQEVFGFHSGLHSIIEQHEFTELQEVFDAYERNVGYGEEGVVLINKYSEYKTGRLTLNSRMGYKMKNDNIEYVGEILDVEEGDKVKEGIATTINELGKSRTSKLKEDREPNGMAKGFLVLLEDGNTLTVSFSGYNHNEKAALLNDKENYIGRTIKFTAMEPTKAHGVPRSAFFIAGNFLT